MNADENTHTRTHLHVQIHIQTHTLAFSDIHDCTIGWIDIYVITL